MSTAANGGVRGWRRTWGPALSALMLLGPIAACGTGGDPSPDSPAATDPEPGDPSNAADAVLVVHRWEGDLLIVDPDSGESRPLDVGIEVAHLASGPAGTPLVLIEDGTSAVHVVDDVDDSASLRQVGDAPPAPLAAPVVSPDGQHLAAVMGEGPEPTFACEPLGPVGGGPIAWPRLLVVGTWVQCEEVTFEATALIDPATTPPTAELHQGLVSVSVGDDRFVVQPDGSVFLAWAGASRYEPSGGLSPVWSSTRRLAYLETRPVPGASVFALMIVEAEAVAATEVMRGHLTPLGWSPDGQVLLFWNADTGSLWRWDPDDGARDLELDQGRVVWATSTGQ